MRPSCSCSTSRPRASSPRSSRTSAAPSTICASRATWRSCWSSSISSSPATSPTATRSWTAARSCWPATRSDHGRERCPPPPYRLTLQRREGDDVGAARARRGCPRRRRSLDRLEFARRGRRAPSSTSLHQSAAATARASHTPAADAGLEAVLRQHRVAASPAATACDCRHRARRAARGSPSRPRRPRSIYRAALASRGDRRRRDASAQPAPRSTGCRSRRSCSPAPVSTAASRSISPATRDFLAVRR